MVLSSMASSAAKKDLHKKNNAQRYAMYSAVVSGISVFLLGIALLVYIFGGGESRSKISLSDEIELQNLTHRSLNNISETRMDNCPPCPPCPGQEWEDPCVGQPSLRDHNPRNRNVQMRRETPVSRTRRNPFLD